MRSIAFAAITLLLVAPIPLSNALTVPVLVPAQRCEGTPLEDVTVPGVAHCWGPELLGNAGFESCPGCQEDAGVVPPGWTFTTVPEWGADGVLSWTRAGARVGDGAVRLTPGPESTDGSSFGILDPDRVAAEPGLRYAASIQALAPGVGEEGAEAIVLLFLDFHDATGKRVGGSWELRSLSEGWNTVRVSHTAPATTATAHVSFEIYSETSLLLDDASLRVTHTRASIG